MPFIGVRISWLMLARNSLLARFARSAASVAVFWSWMSVQVPYHFAISPLASRTGRARARCQRYSPSEARRKRSAAS